jgi:hypothetical protein
VQVEQAPDGRTHGELSHRLGARVHNALLELVHEGRIGRERYRGQHLYVSADAERAAEQVRLEALCDTVRLDIELAGALRWVRRRVPSVHDILTTLKGLLGEPFVVVAPTLMAFGIHLGVTEVLVALRGIAAETIRDWLKRYRRGGFEALLPKPRADRGQARHLPPSVVEALLATKEGNPQLSVQLVIRAVRQRPEVPPDLPLPLSTVHRLLARHGLMDSTKTGSETQDRRRFAFAQAGELWMSDVMHGPSVVVGERVKRKTYLIAFIDDATRVIPHAAFCLSENTRSFLPVLEQAILRRGLPQKLLRRQWRQLPLQASGAGVCQARHRADPCPTLSASGQGQDRALVQNRARAAADPPHRGRCGEPHGAQPPPRRLGRGRVSP